MTLQTLRTAFIGLIAVSKWMQPAEPDYRQKISSCPIKGVNSSNPNHYNQDRLASCYGKRDGGKQGSPIN